MARTVRCDTADCSRAGIVVMVPDREVARGVVARPPLHCAACGSVLRDEAPAPPEQAVRRPRGERRVAR